MASEIVRFKLAALEPNGPRALLPDSECGPWTRYSNHLADKAAELEKLAGEFEKGGRDRLRDADEKNVAGKIAAGAAANEARAIALRLRERAAEIRRGDD